MTATFDPTDVARYQMAGQDLPWLVRARADAHPDKTFLVWDPREGDNRSWTYRQFVDDVEALAGGLHARGVRAGDKVLIHADNCPEGVLSWYACAFLGAVAVTTNTKSAGPEIEYFASHTGCVGAITQPQYATLVQQHAPELKWIVVTDDNSGEAPAAGEADHGLDGFDTLVGDPADIPERERDPLAPVGILFTSGTTSRPKAVVHTHGNALWAAKMGPRNVDFHHDDRYLIYLPFFHVNAQSWSIWTCLGAGGTVVLTPKWSASRFWDLVQTHEITHISLMPFVLQTVAQGEIPEHTIRVGVFGLLMPMIDDWLGIRVTAHWGMTETVIHATRDEPDGIHPDGTMGKPTPGYEYVVVNQDTGEICGEDEIGELWVRGTRGIQLFLEYHDNDEAMAKAFTDDGWFKTGDMVVLGADGNFFYKDRDKDALKVGGENVSAREVEDCIRQVPGLADIAVVAQSHDYLDMVPVAFVIPAGDIDQDATATQIMETCSANLADFKVPRAVYFVDEFPKATLDKVAKNVLRDWADERRETD